MLCFLNVAMKCIMFVIHSLKENMLFVINVVVLAYL